jgi:alanyl-tRNA synthetase
VKAAEVRKAFLEFFRARNHEIVASSSLVPANDPTLLFTNAGMNQFKDVFTGLEQRPYKRATSSQKCVRAGGKHNDLDEVGKTPRHHTFFEMLGNFSFGDYFKTDAIPFAWELLTKTYGIDPSRMCVTVFGGDKSLAGVAADDEARAIWKQVTGYGDDRVIGLGAKDNFWQMGDTGPMGPCTEIHYFMDGKPSAWPTQDPASWKGWLEIWNLVFMQFERRTAGGELFPLPAPSVDTGAGLERVTSVVQGVASNYDTDLFTGILQQAAELSGKKYGADTNADTSMRVIADHARTSAFLIADGVFPDKTGREYVLRRIFRRAVRHGGKLLGIKQPFMHEVCMRVVEEMGDQFPELRERKQTIHDVALEEEKRFRDTLDRGEKLLDEEFARMAKSSEKQVSGKAVFTLYDTFGFPDDLTEIIASERGFGVDKLGFNEELDKAREKSKFSGSDQEAIAGDIKAVANEVGATKFLGYEGRGTTGTGVIRAMLVGGKRATTAPKGTRVQLVFDQTPFYGESGGQTGDTGEVRAKDATVRIDDTKKPAGDVHVLIGEVTEGTLNMGDEVIMTVDDDRRERIRANHSATHLLHHALKDVLGNHVAQKGSLVAPDRLRFDFTHFSQMTEEQKRQVEDIVNAEIRKNIDTKVEVLPIEEAKQRGAVAMFGEKYGDRVRVVSIGGESIEFCGGTHVRRAGDIGLLKIVSEAGVAQGVRRIEAVTGAGAMDYLRKLEDELTKVVRATKAQSIFDAAAKANVMATGMTALTKEIDKLKQRIASGGGGRDLLSETVMIKGIKVLAAAVEVDDAKVLRDTGDQLRDKLGSGVIVLAGTGGAEVKLIAMVTKDLVGKVQAGKLLGEVAAQIGGRAGGKPDMAQGGGKDAAGVPAALVFAREWIEKHA